MGRHFYKGQSKISLVAKMGEERKVKSVGFPLFPVAAVGEEQVTDIAWSAPI